jgi:hypothetical protein
VLLFVFWYCHKRGREVRLEKERQLTEEEMQKLDVEYRSENPTTTAEEGASIEEVKAGIDEVRGAKQAGQVPEQRIQAEPVPVPPTTVP